ncbi:kinase-like domain-containing protein, partial [Coemansia mojavensis]
NLLRKKYYVKYFDISLLGYSDDPRSAFDSEIDAHEKISRNPHKNICKYYGCLESDPGYMDNKIVGIVLERYNITLKQAVEKNLLQDKDKIVHGLESAIKHLHSIDIVHGDINPNNIMVSNDGEPIVIDFDSSSTKSPKGGSEGWISEEYNKSRDDDYYSLRLIQEYM